MFRVRKRNSVSEQPSEKANLELLEEKDIAKAAQDLIDKRKSLPRGKGQKTNFGISGNKGKEGSMDNL